MTKYYVDDNEVSEDEFRTMLEDNTREDVENNYDNMLDECYEPYQVGVCTFYASQVLKECDPVAYDCGINDFVDSNLSDSLYDLERGDEVEVNGITFRQVEAEGVE